MMLAGIILLWFLNLYYRCKDAIKSIWRVLYIKMHHYGQLNAKEVTHVAVRLNDALPLDHKSLLQLIEHVKQCYDVKYLTIVAGQKGLGKAVEIEIEVEDAGIYYNYDASTGLSSDAKLIVNIIDLDSRGLLLQKWKDARFEDLKITSKHLTSSKCTSLTNCSLPSYRSFYFHEPCS